MIVGNYELFCKDFHLCEGYEKAINSSEDYFLHHIIGEKISREELIEQDLYYDCEPENLRWVTLSEHNKIHHKGKVISDETRKKMSEAKKGNVFSAETREKISEALKGKRLSTVTKKKMSAAHKGKVISAETRKKMSEARKGMSWKLVDGKRIWFKKEYSS